MSSSAILLATLAIVVCSHARFIAPIRPLLPVPFIGPIHPPLITPFVPPIVPIHPPIIPIIGQRRVQTTNTIPRPPSRPFVMEEPRGFLPREEEPVFINIVERPNPVRDVYVIEDKRRPMYERPRYIEDSNNGDISIDGNVYISDPYAVNDLQRGASVEQVVSRNVGSGNLAAGGRADYDYPIPAVPAGPAVSFNMQTGPIDPIINTRPVTII